MNPSYTELLRDLGLAEHQIEAIQDLNSEVIDASLAYADAHADMPEDCPDSNVWQDYTEQLAYKQDYYLRTEGLIK